MLDNGWKSVSNRKRPTFTLSLTEPIGFARDATPPRGCRKGSATLWKAPFHQTSAPAHSSFKTIWSAANVSVKRCKLFHWQARAWEDFALGKSLVMPCRPLHCGSGCGPCASDRMLQAKMTSAELQSRRTGLQLSAHAEKATTGKTCSGAGRTNVICKRVMQCRGGSSVPLNATAN